jgi:hypothetical protein
VLETSRAAWQSTAERSSAAVVAYFVGNPQTT